MSTSRATELRSRRLARERKKRRQHLVASLFACAVVTLPIALLALVPRELSLTTSANVKALPAFQARKIDGATAPQLFNEPLISVTFDDGWESTYTAAAPLLNRYGIHSTQYLISGVVGSPQYMSLTQIQALAKDGNEVACHTVTHPDLTTLNATQLAYQLNGCQQYFSRYFGTIRDFASPYGATNATTLAAIAQVYRSQRNTGGALSSTDIQSWAVNLPSNFDPYNITSIAVRHDTTVAELKAAVAYTVAHNGWLVLTYHQADDGKAGTFSYEPKSLQQQLQYLSSTNVRIATVGQVIGSLPAEQ